MMLRRFRIVVLATSRTLLFGPRRLVLDQDGLLLLGLLILGWLRWGRRPEVVVSFGGFIMEYGGCECYLNACSRLW